MDYIKRQGTKRLKVSLQQLRKMDIFEEIEQPDCVYHMTDKENLEDILADGKIKSFQDYLTYFFPDSKFVPIYIALSGALIGRQYYSTDGRIITAAPLNIENTVVLRLVPKRKEKLEWYREVVDSSKKGYSGMPQFADPLWKKFNECRIAHYGDFQFRTDEVTVMELKEIYKNMPDDVKEVLDWFQSFNDVNRKNATMSGIKIS